MNNSNINSSLENVTLSTNDENRASTRRRATRPPARSYNFRRTTIYEREVRERQRHPSPEHRLRIRRRPRLSAEDIVDLTRPPSLNRPRAPNSINIPIFPIVPMISPMVHRQSGLSQEEIDKHTILFDYKTENFDTNDQCCICLDQFSSPNVLRKLRCLHFFHKNCIDEWLHAHKNCPFCRASVMESH